MNITELDKFMPYCEAAKQGKTIEGRDVNANWHQLLISGIEVRDLLFWTDNGTDMSAIRIKPEPKLRAWKPEEVPPLALIRRKDKRWHNLFEAIICVEKCGKMKTSTIGEWCVQSAFEVGEHSTDNGKTWKPCGVQD